MLKMHSGVMYLLQGPCKWNLQKLLTLKTEIDLFRLRMVQMYTGT